MFKVISSIVCCSVLVFVYIMLMNLMTIIPLKLNGKNTKCIMHVYSKSIYLLKRTFSIWFISR